VSLLTSQLTCLFTFLKAVFERTVFERAPFPGTALESLRGGVCSLVRGSVLGAKFVLDADLGIPGSMGSGFGISGSAALSQQRNPVHYTGLSLSPVNEAPHRLRYALPLLN